MSQVRKFSKGGDTAESTEKKSNHDNKYGHYIVDGKTYDVNDDFINNYITSAKKFNDAGTNRIASYVVNALKSGQDVSFDTLNNRVTGINQYLNTDDIARSNEYYSGPQNNKMRRKYQRKEINKNTDLHQTNIGIKNLGSIQFTTPKEEPVESPKLIDLYGEDRILDYNKNADGSVTWSTGPQNAGNIAAINNFFDFLGMSNEEADKKYSYEGKENWINDLRHWYIDNPNYKEGLISRMKSNQLDGADWDVLSWMGFTRNENSNDSSYSTSTQPRSYEGSRLNNDWLTRNNYYVQKGSDGNTYLYRLGTDENGKPKYLIDTSAKIYLPNMGILGDNSQWNGGAIINGRFYTENEIWDPNSAAGQSFAELTRAWNSGSGETSWQNAKNTGWQFAGSDADNYMFSAYNRNTGTNPLWDQYFDKYKDDDNIWYVRNLANNFLGTPKGMEIISYIDQNNRSKAGYENPYFAVYNPTDKKFKRFENEEALNSYLQGLNIQKQSSLYSGDANFDIYDFLFDKNKNRYSYVSPINTFTGTGSSQQSTELYKGPDGNYYYLLDNSNPEDLQFIRIDDQNVVNQILNGQTISNENLPSWAKRRLLERGKRKYMRQGGKINFDKVNNLQKYQYGGIFSNPYTGSTNKKERNKDAKITISDSHQAFGGGKHGVRTKADKLANWATGFDTAAVGTSFIPGYGNIVGAVSGLTGSALRFASDIKKDGFQGGDLLRFLGNVGLDALTLIPGLGTAAAGAKAAKGASKVAKVASKVVKTADKVKDTPVLGSVIKGASKVGKASQWALPALGVTDASITAIEAATDGQPVTTDQIQRIAGGLMGGALLGRKIGKEINKSVLKSVQKELGISKPKEFSYKGVKLTDSDISNLQGKKVKEVNKILYDKLKDAKVDLKNISTDFKKSTLYSDFGLDLNGKIFKKINIPKNEENIELTNPKLYNRLRNANSFWDKRAATAYREKLLANPNALKSLGLINKLSIDPAWRFGGINASWGTAPKNLSLNKANITRTGRQTLSKMYHSGVSNIQSAKDYVTKNITPDKQEYWLELLNNRSKDFTKLFNNLNKTRDNAAQRVKLFDSFKFKKGGKIIKAQNGVKWNPGDLVMDNNLADPNLYDYQSHGISFNGSNVDWTKTYATNSQFDKMRQNYIKNWNNPEFNSVKQAYLNQLSSNNNNIDVTNFSLDNFKDYTSDQKLGWAHKLNTDEYKQFIHTLPVATVTATKSTLPQITGKAIVQNQSNPIVSQINSRLNNTPITRSSNGDSNEASNENSTGNDATGIEKKNWFNFNPDDLIGGLELARSLIANNRMYGELKDANRAVLREMPTEIYDRYQDHITPIYQEAANQKRQFFVPTSTDTLTNYAMRQANEDAAQALLTEGRLKASEAYSHYLDKDLAARRAYAEDRRQTAFANRQEMANKVMRDAQINQARRLANNQSWSNFVMEMRNKISQDRNRSLNFLQQQDRLLAQQKMNESLSNFEKEWRDKFAALSEDERKSKNYLDWQDYAVRSDPQAYQRAMTEANLAGQQYLLDNQNKYVDYIFNRVPIVQLLTNNRTVSMPATGYYKKGGKVSNKYTQRHYGPKPDEAIWIQRNKDTAKALEKLHDAVIKLFMKSIS